MNDDDVCKAAGVKKYGRWLFVIAYLLNVGDY